MFRNQSAEVCIQHRFLKTYSFHLRYASRFLWIVCFPGYNDGPRSPLQLVVMETERHMNAITGEAHKCYHESIPSDEPLETWPVTVEVAQPQSVHHETHSRPPLNGSKIKGTILISTNTWLISFSFSSRPVQSN